VSDWLGVGVTLSKAAMEADAVKTLDGYGSRWYKEAVSRESPVRTVRWKPSSLENEVPLELIGQSVSNANGINMCMVASVWYLSYFLLAAPAAAPLRLSALLGDHSANVSVTFHVTQRPECH